MLLLIHNSICRWVNQKEEDEGGISRFFAPYADIMTMLVVVLVAVNSSSIKQIVEYKSTAERVPGLEETVQGLKGENERLTDANGGLQKKVGSLEAENRGLDANNRKLANENGGLRDKLGETQQKLSDAEERLRPGEPVTVFAWLDCSGSMGANRDALASAMSLLAESMSTTSRDFRFGLLAYRNGVVARLPITKVRPFADDRGRSQQLVLDFIKGLQVLGANTDHRPVFAEGFKMLRAAHPQHDPSRAIRILLLGDTGPAELDGQLGYSQHERQVKQQLLADMRRWAEQGNHGIASFYTANKFTAGDPGAGESRQWFQALGSVSPQSQFYTDTNDLIRAIRKAAGK